MQAGNLTIKLNFGIAQKNATLQASPTPKVAAPTESVQNFGTAQKNSTPITEIALKETEEKLAEETAEETDEETEEETEDDTDEETNEETNEETEEEIEDNTDEEIEDDTDEETDEDTDEDTEEDNVRTRPQYPSLSLISMLFSPPHIQSSFQIPPSRHSK